jgi:heme A synthase
MRTAYQVLAYSIAALVVVQAAVIAVGMFGLMAFLQDGGSVDIGLLESGTGTPNAWGFIAHGVVGTIVIPLVAIALVVVSFFARVPGGVRWAFILFGVIALQVLLAFLSLLLSGLGLLHGAIALVIFGMSVSSAIRVRRAVPATVASPVPA